MKVERGWIVKNVKPHIEKGWRRVVPSPDPILNIESETIRGLVNSGVVVIASGCVTIFYICIFIYNRGGGIPVVKKTLTNSSGLSYEKYVGVEAVIDKDLSGQRLASAIDADIFMILTDVDAGVLNYGKPNAQKVGFYLLFYFIFCSWKGK
jgi:carbamate kinase